MKKNILKYIVLVVIIPVISFAGMNDRFSNINLKEANYVELPEIAVPSGNPSSNTAWFYCKDSSGVSNLYFENDAGTVFNLSAPSYAGNVDITGTLDGNGTGVVSGMLYTVENHIAGDTLTIAETQTIHTNSAASGAVILNLTEASTAIGMSFTFITITAQNFDINPDDADTILSLTNAAGDAIRSAAVGDSITIMAMDATNWVVIASSNSTNSADSWADVN